MKAVRVQRLGKLWPQLIRLGAIAAATVSLSACPSDASDFIGFLGGVYNGINTTLDPAGLSVLPGQTALAKASITRDPGWDGDASFAVTGAPTGVTVDVINVATSGVVTSADLRFTVAPDVPYKSYDLVLHGNMDTHEVKTVKENLVPFTLTVRAPFATITLSDQKLSLKAGQTQNVTATVVNASGAGKVQWVTADPSIVTVSPGAVDASSSGAATTLKAVKKGGPVNVIANYTSADGSIFTSQIEVTVTDSAQGASPVISVSPASVNPLPVGQQVPVSVFVTSAVGTTPVQWTSSDPSVVSVSPANVAALATGASTTFTGVKAGGPVDVIASYTANGVTVTAKVAVTVAAPTSNAVVAMYLDPISAEYTPAAGNFYRARLINAQGTEVAATSDGGSITYATSDTAVINIDAASGFASVVKKAVTSARTAAITAVYKKNGQTVATAAPSAVTVYPAGGTDMGAVQFSIAGSASRITVGQTIQFQIVVRDQTGIQQTSRAVRDQLVVTSSSSTALQVTAVGPDSYFFNMTAKALPGSSALTGVPNVVTIKADINGAMITIPMIIMP
jgi:uncharacterized protein YjdB